MLLSKKEARLAWDVKPMVTQHLPSSGEEKMEEN